MTTGSSHNQRRAVGVDFGSKRIGIAICDSGGLVATPHETIKRVGDESVEHGRIGEIAEAIGAKTIVVGLPIDLDGEIGVAARAVQNEVRRLGRRLEQRLAGVDVVTHDERLTTVTADRSLREQGIRGSSRSEMIDQVAAATILQSWLDATSLS